MNVRKAPLEPIYRLFPDPEASLLAGILLRVDQGLPEGVETAFRKNGTAIIAISGFNMSIVAGLFFALFGGCSPGGNHCLHPAGGGRGFGHARWRGDKLYNSYAVRVSRTMLFDPVRRKRHRVIYEIARLASQKKAEQAIVLAKEFSEKIEAVITGN